ncbi:MAG: hypothetical protein KatS3mg043_1775 [Rhodothermaceae bacterium]|nr:MAG: hypothetical protein KatS3mg043_1775 [Rhodothermaceae bacterium]
MTLSAHTSIGGLVVRMGLVVVPGIPLVAYLWETLHQLLSLHVNTTRLLISLPVLVALIVWLRWVSRRVRQWMGEETS